MAQTGRGLDNSYTNEDWGRLHRPQPDPSVPKSTRPLQMAPGHPFSMAKCSRRHSDVGTGPWHGRRRLAWPKRAVALRIPRPTRPGHGGIEHSPIRPCQSLRGRSKWLRGIPLAWPSVRVDIPMSVRGRGTAVDAWHVPNGPWPREFLRHRPTRPSYSLTARSVRAKVYAAAPNGS